MAQPPPTAQPLAGSRATRRPLALWLYIGAGCAMIIWSGVKIVASPFRR